MSPIKNLTETRRLPRLGKIHLGVKKQAKSGKWYPSATDYFVVPPEISEALGDQAPTQLPIVFPIEDDEKFASQFYRSYSMTRGLVCRGDGETCRRTVDAETGEMANRNSTEVYWKDGLPCQGRDCPYYGKQCKEVMCLQFLLPTVEGLGVWQIDTSSINSILNINSAIELVRGVYGRIAMIPLLLTLEPIEVINPDDGKKKTVRVLNLRTKGTMIDLMKQALKPAREMLLPAPLDTEAPEDMEQPEPPPSDEGLETPIPDDEAPELVMPQNQIPKERSSPAGKETDWRAFWERAEQLGLSNEQVFKMLGVTTSVKEWTAQDKTVDEAIELISQRLSQPKSTEAAELAGEDFNIDLTWLSESKKALRWTDDTCKTFLVSQYKVSSQGTLTEVFNRLTREQAEDFVNQINKRLENQPKLI